MSCDSKRRKFLRGLAPNLPTWASAVGLDDPARCARWLERIYQVGANRGRNWETSHPSERWSQNEKTTMGYVATAAADMREEMKRAGMTLHNHGDGRSSGADWGYAQLRWTLDALQQRGNLPPVAAESYLEELSDYINVAKPLEDIPLSKSEPERPASTYATESSTAKPSTQTFNEVVTPTGDSFHPSQLGNCGRCGRFYNTTDPASHLCPDLAKELGEEDELEEALVVSSDGYGYSLAQCERCSRCGGLYLWRDGHACAAEQLSLPLAVESDEPEEPDALVDTPQPASSNGPRSIYYFAFGSNMNPERLKNRRVRFSRRLLGQVTGWSLAFNKKGGGDGVGFANVMPANDATVEGALYEMPLSAVEDLSRYEGYPQHYGLQPAMVEIGNGRAVPAVMYVAQPWQVADGLRPTRDYLDHLLCGKDLLSAEYLERLGGQSVAQSPARGPKKAEHLADEPRFPRTRETSTKQTRAGNQSRQGASKVVSRRRHPGSSTFGGPSRLEHLTMETPGVSLNQALAMLHGEQPAQRWEGVRTLAHLTASRGKKAIDPVIVEHTIGAVADDNWNVRAATQRLYDRLAQDPQVRQQLLRAYNSPDRRRRLAVVAAIRAAKDRPEVRRLLSAALGDPDDEVAAMAEYVFWRPTDGADHPRVAPPGWGERISGLQAADARVDHRHNWPFFVYGTLRRGAGNYNALLHGRTLVERPAQMENGAMYTPGLAYVADSPFDRVVGDLMWIADEDFPAVARSLDRLEGFDPAHPGDAWGYRRVAREVLAHNGAGEPYLMRAWVYQGVSADGHNRSWTADTFRPSGDWLDRPGMNSFGNSRRER